MSRQYDEFCYDTIDEEWRRVSGCWDYYISSAGRIATTKDGYFRLLRPTRNRKTGYLYVTLIEGTNKEKFYIHRLVAEAFIPNPYKYPIVRHLDDDPSNNVIYNLAWGTAYDNVQDSKKSGHFYYFTREDIRKANLVRATPIRAINIKTGEVLIFESQCDAGRYFGVSQGMIRRLLDRKRRYDPRSFVEWNFERLEG